VSTKEIPKIGRGGNERGERFLAEELKINVRYKSADVRFAYKKVRWSERGAGRDDNDEPFR